MSRLAPADFSVIIPALNEEAHIAATVANVRAQGAGEIIVVDGGSTDGTRAAARGADRLVMAPRGRAVQMNAGAAQSGRDSLLFLHADCMLDAGALAQAANLLSQPGIIAGCFAMRVTAPSWRYRAIDAAASARVRLAGIAYGDQGLFLRRETFDRLGGFPPLRLMEDVFLSLKLRQFGKVAVARSKVFVSARRWQRVGLVRQTLRNWALTAAAAFGASPDRLARFYPVVR